MSLKWTKSLWKKLTGESQEKTQTSTGKNNKIGDGSNLKQVSISDKSLVSNINSGGSGNTYYNINNLGRDVIITMDLAKKQKKRGASYRNYQ